MRHTPHYLLTDPLEVARLIRENPWATFVSTTSKGLVASHYPVLLEEPALADERDPHVSIVTHFGRPDEVLHELGQGELLVIIQGPHGYVSPSWYGNGEIIPTWNHVTAHLYGVPEFLTEDENYRVLETLTDHFEHHLPHGTALSTDEAYARRVAKGTLGFRMRVTRFDARAKLSQNKKPEVAQRITEQLRTGEHYSQPALADEMERVHRRDS
jgi:transcriptional regulator